MEMEMEMKKWCRTLPKIELHAHLNGSVRGSTLLELAIVLGEKGVIAFPDVQHVIMKEFTVLKVFSLDQYLAFGCFLPLAIAVLHNLLRANWKSHSDGRSLPECFQLFDLYHILTTDHATVKRITREVIEDFAAENVVYLELRTTPKNNEAKGMTKHSYMKAVIDGLRTIDTIEVAFLPSDVIADDFARFLQDDACNGTQKRKIFVRLLLSIDRCETTAAAMETVNLALELRDMGVVGIDLSGNPTIGEWQTFLPALKYAKEQGLPITLHCGEVPNRKEIQAMLEFHPERIGHACYLEEEDWKKLKASKIPVEICLTSNVRTERVDSVKEHHFIDLYNAKHPISLCTDDVGLFSTTLSNEYYLIASTFGFRKEEMFGLSRKAIEFVFADDGVKRTLAKIYDAAEKRFIL